MGNRGNAALILFASLAILTGAWLFVRDQPVPTPQQSVQASPSDTQAVSKQNHQNDLRFAESVVDLGVIKSEVHHNLIIENHSKGAARIVNVRSSCACTAAAPARDVLKPGAREKIAVTFKPRMEKIGRQKYVIDVDYQSDALRTVRAEIHFEFRPDVSVPESIALHSFAGKAAITKFMVIDFRDQPLKIKDLQSTSPDLTVRIVEEPTAFAPGWHYRLEATYTNDTLAPGHYAETILLHTEDKDESPLSIPVNIERVHRIRVAPGRARLRPDPQDSNQLVGFVFADDAEGKDVTIISASPSSEQVRCNYDRHPRALQRIEIRADANWTAGNDEPLTLTLTLKSAITRQVCVPVLAPSSPCSR